MGKKIFSVWSGLFIFSLLITGCTSTHSLSQGRSFKLKQVSYNTLPGWNQDNFTESLPALLNSCQYPTPMFTDFCHGLQSYKNADSDQIKHYIESKLTPYLVISYGSTVGTITGYYEAELTGTRTRIKESQVPVYGVPYGYKNGKTYPARSVIEGSDFNAPIIAWADDPVEFFILQIQGSGRMKTPEGEIRLGYAGSNGRTFKGLGKLLKENGVPNLYSMPAMKKWLQEHPTQARKIMAQNPRYIFFKEIKGDSPYGAAGVILTPQRSVAVDKSYIPMHTPLFLHTKDPDGPFIRKLVVAQDIGSAIQGGIRADYFWGHGSDAFKKAGRMKSEGTYYLLLPKN